MTSQQQQLWKNPQDVALLASIGRVCAVNNQAISLLLRQRFSDSWHILNKELESTVAEEDEDEDDDFDEDDLEEDLEEDDLEDQDHLVWAHLRRVAPGFSPSKLFSMQLKHVPYMETNKTDPDTTTSSGVSFSNQAFLLHPLLDQLAFLSSSSTSSAVSTAILRLMHNTALSVLEYHYALCCSLLAMHAIVRQDATAADASSSHHYYYQTVPTVSTSQDQEQDQEQTIIPVDAEIEQQSYYTIAAESYRCAEDLLDETYRHHFSSSFSTTTTNDDITWILLKLALCNNQVHIFAQAFFYDPTAMAMNANRMKLPLHVLQQKYNDLACRTCTNKCHAAAASSLLRTIQAFRHTLEWAQEHDDDDDDDLDEDMSDYEGELRQQSSRASKI